MPLSSLILRYEPAERERLLTALDGIPEITIVEKTEAAVAVLLEAPDARREWAVAERLPALPGCTGVELLVHVPDEEAVADLLEAPPASERGPV